VKYWVWVIFLGAGVAAAYVLFSPGSSTDNPSSEVNTPEVTQDNAKENQVDTLLHPPLGGAATETVLPLDAALKPARVPGAGPLTTNNQDVPAGPRHSDTPEADRQDDRDAERDLVLNDIFQGKNEPTAFRRTKMPTTVGTAAPSSPQTPAAAFAVAPSSPPSSIPSGSSGLSSASFGGTFPALPRPLAGPTSSGPTKAVFSAGGGTQNPTANKTVASLPTPSEPPPTSATSVTKKTETVDEIIRPSGASGATGGNGNQTTPEGDADPESAWMEAMKIPAGFSGLSLSPKSVTLTAMDPATAADTPNQTVILAATLKSSFGADETPTLLIQRECSDAGPNCDPHVPTGGPSLMDYFFQNGRHQEDLVPDSKDSLQIGTTVIGTVKDANGKEVTEAEVAFHLLAGSVPGKYTVGLAGKNAKLTGSFEVVAVTATTTAVQPMTDASLTHATSVGTQTAQPQKPPATK
jgi:hypothetical protein